MLRSEDGYTFLEGIVSFGFIMLIVSALFPLMMTMLGHLKEGKKEMAAYRLMYEHAERQAALGELESTQVTWDHLRFDINMEENEKGDWKVCIRYEEKVHCID